MSLRDVHPFSQVFKYHVNKFKPKCQVRYLLLCCLLFTFHILKCYFPGHHCQEMCICNNVPLLSAPLRAVLHHMFGAGSAPLSFLLTRRMLLSVPSRQPHHCFPQLPLAQSKQNTACPYALSTFPNSLMGGMC